MMRATALLAVLLLLVSTVSAQEAPPRPLALGTPAADSLAAEQAHSYALNLDAGQFVYGVVDQETVDVVVTVYALDGSVVGAYDGPARGPEPFQFDTETAGTYRIEVAPFEDETGRYTIHLRRAEPLATTPESRVDQLMVPYDGEVPGGVVAVVQDGELAFAKAYGLANLTHAIPFTVDTPTNIGSTSKQFTAFALALLEARGQLSLDDDVRTYIPELPDFGTPVTLRHLLTHTSGYRAFFNALALAGRRLDQGDGVDRDELIEIIQRQPELQNEPGAEWNYNNTAFGLAATVVERVTDTPFPQWMDANVFEPLGMTHTTVRADPATIVPHSAQGYTPSADGYREAPDLGAAIGAGGIYSTVGDLAAWMRNLQTGELGGPAVVEALQTPYVLSDGDTTTYGLGLFIDEQGGLRRVHHGGADIAHRSMLMLFPALDAGVLTLSNNASFDAGANGLPADVAEAFFADHMTLDEEDDVADAEPADFDPEQYDAEAFDALAGRYELEAVPGFVLTFTREGDDLFTQATGQPKLEIVPTSDSTFALTAVEASVTFHRGDDGTAEALTLHQNGHHRATRLEEEPWTPDDLTAYTGRYFSEELETFYTIAVEDSALVLQHRRLDDQPLTPRDEDLFGGGFPVAEVAFVRNDAGAVTGLLASNGRTRGVRFVKQD